MSQNFRVAPTAATAMLLASVVVGCGHEIKVPDVKDIVAGTGGTSGTSGTAGAGVVGGSAGLGGSSMGGTGMVSGDMCGDRPYTLVVNTHDMTPGYVQDPNVLAEVNRNIGLMMADEKIAQMQGVSEVGKDYDDIERSPDVPEDKTGLRGYRYRDAGRGVNLAAGQDNRPTDSMDFSTVFPTESVRAASWDLDLEWRVGEAMGDEVAGTLNNMLLAPCMNIIRHPFWGRTQETYSEDMYHTGRMASALTAGIQQHVVACAKHFAANNIENVRKDQDAIMDEQTLREIYGRHFEMVIKDGGIGCIMASYNSINGTKSTQNHHLLTDILRDDFGYKGLVISDWWAMPGDIAATDVMADMRPGPAADAVNAGLDIEVPWTIYYGTLNAQVASGMMSIDLINKAASHILEQKVRFNTLNWSDPWGKGTITTQLATGAAGPASIYNAPHHVLAEETLMKSAVLLRNGPADGTAPVLPLKDKPTVAVVGIDYSYVLRSTTCPDRTDAKASNPCHHNFVTDANLGDRGSSRVNGDPNVDISPIEGMQMIAPMHGTTTVTPATGDATAALAAATAANADAYVVVVGLTAGDEGEEYAIPSGGDRATMGLPGDQVTLVTGVLALNKPTVIIVESGSIIDLPWIGSLNQATIWAGYPGTYGGSALAKLIFADNGANFSGKMPMAWPPSNIMPPFLTDPANPIRNEMGYFFGYRYYDQMGLSSQLIFPFGHGLSYTTFEYSNLVMPTCASVSKGGVVEVKVDIENKGTVNGEEVVMLFVAPPPNAKAADDVGQRPVKELKAFTKVPVAAGMKVTATMNLRVSDLRRWKPDAMNPNSPTGTWVIDPGAYTLMVGKNAADAEAGTLKQTVNIQ